MFNERLKSLRITKGLSQVELAKILNVSKQSISNWENDNIQPSVEMLVHLADIFNVTTDYLLCRNEKRDLDVTGLTDAQIMHIQNIISDIKK